ncbi:phage recombination protein Bet, partial [Acinetobacter baumannii]
MSNIVLSQVSKIASAFNMQDVDPAELANTLVNTVFKKATNDEFLSLLIVANQYKLNPFTKEIYAFPAKGGGITPVVGIDGWARIINDNPVCDGIQFEQDEESCTCKIFRKDRNHPTVVTEYLSECQGNSEPWKKYPKRMLRHKALIQCARVAFGFSGIYDE